MADVIRTHLSLINDFLRETRAHHEERPRIVCQDGFSLSVQASRHHKSNPQKNRRFYTAVEVGSPSEKEAVLLPSQIDDKPPTEGRYAWVAANTVGALILGHGGIDREATFGN